MSALWNTVWPILLAIFMFVVIIVIHEFGHFISAKLNGVRVNEFSIGFGPKIISKQGKETLYSIRAVPFGGYCAMEGEDEESSDIKAFSNKKAWRRFIIVAAGAAFNLILGFVLAVIMTIPQERFATTTVAQFDENAVSNGYDLRIDDEIIKANGRRIFCFSDLSYMLSSSRDGKIDFTVIRDGKETQLNGVQFNLQKLDDGNSYIDLDFKVYGEEKTFLTTVKYAAKTTVSYGRIVYMSLFDMITGKYKLNQLSGPVGITATVSNAAKESLWNVIYLGCIISINLGVMNLLPLPALDGGRLIFIIIEMIRRKPIPAKYEGIVHTVGFAILFVLIIFITFNDIFNLIR